VKRKGWLIALLVVGLAALGAVAPDRSGLKSPQATEQIMQRLGVRWAYPGPPVVLIFGPGCGDCQVLQELLNAEGVNYELVNVVATPHAREVLGQISRSRLGRAMEPLTPTTIVGTRVIRGPDADAVVAAVKQQHDW